MNDDQIRREIHEQAMAHAEQEMANLKKLRKIGFLVWLAVSAFMYWGSASPSIVATMAFALIGGFLITVVDGLVYPLIRALSPFVYFLPMWVFDLATGSRTLEKGVSRNAVRITAGFLYLLYVLLLCVLSYRLIF